MNHKLDQINMHDADLQKLSLNLETNSIVIKLYHENEVKAFIFHDVIELSLQGLIYNSNYGLEVAKCVIVEKDSVFQADITMFNEKNEFSKLSFQFKSYETN